MILKTFSDDQSNPSELSTHILLVDDEYDLLRALSATLTRAGWQVTTASDGQQALHVFRRISPNLIILDLMLPVLDGWEVCREVRKTSDVPIIMLTARDDSVDKILGLELGADDYVTKPFDSRELIARIRAILRRANRTYTGTTLRLADFEINLESQTVSRDGKQTVLTPTEFDLLVHLARHPGRVFSREDLLEQVWGYDFPGDLRTVDVHVRRLRLKVEQDPAHPTLIRTRFGVGYVLVP